MTPLDPPRDLLRELADRATPGPWIASPSPMPGGGSLHVYSRKTNAAVVYGHSITSERSSDHDVRFIAACDPDTIKGLLAREDDARRTIAELAAERDAARDSAHYRFGCAVWLWLSDRWDTDDGWQLAELAVAAGLAERVSYNPDIHGVCEAEPGDDIIYPLKGW